MRIPVDVAVRSHGHAHFWDRAAAAGITRGQFIKRGAGAAGALAGLTLLTPGLARAANSSPKPIPGGFTNTDLGLPSPPYPSVFHVMAPGVLTPPNSEPITITDFDGHIGYAVIDGGGTGTNTSTGATKHYSTNVDMRFMQGAYVGEDGGVRHGSFGFVWLDIYDGPVGTNQIHDYNPGIASNGLFWTMPISDDAIDVNPGKGRARYAAQNLSVPDFGDFVNAILPGGASAPATVSFDVRWFDIQSRRNAKEPDFGFAGEFVVTKASIEWSSQQAGFRFQSDAASTSITDYAIVGNERNGVFFA